MEEFIDFNEELNNPGFVFPVIDEKTFIDCLLPPLKGGIDLNLVKSTLKKEDHTDSQGGWKGFWTVSEGRKRKKHDTFAPLLDIFEKATSITSAKTPHLEQVLEMVLLPEPDNERCRKDKSSQTACFYIRSGPSGKACGREASWLNIALTASFNRTANDASRKQNSRKIISNIQLAMVRDLSRRFSFGITVENTTMRLWFCSRASPVVSTPFDFSKDLDILLHVFLSLAFAERHELGWDPTMRPVPRSDGSCVYHIDVDSETYETRETLSSSSGEQLLGHATRVWRVRRLDTNGSESEDASFVLKDVWIEDDREPEHVLVERLLNDVEEKYGTETRHKLESHLLTPFAHCFVRVNGEEDHTTNVMMRGYLPTYKEKYRVNVEHLGGDGNGGEDEGHAGPITEIGVDGLRRNGLRDPLHWYNSIRRIPRRKHYRVVLREVANSVSALRHLGDVFKVLSDTAKALKWIHGAGWVHRDLSVGNLYLYKGRGLIGDFEYAKRKHTDVEDEELTGTREFVAVEAAERDYLHRPPEDDSLVEARRKALREKRVEDLARLQDCDRPPRFFHNDLHDLESLWWIAIWKILNCDTEPAVSSTMIDANGRTKQREHAKDLLFPRSDATLRRALFLRTNAHYQNYLAWFQCDALKMTLGELRGALITKYSKFEAGFPVIQMRLFKGTHSLFRDLFRRCRDCVREANLRLGPIPGRNCRLIGSEGSSIKNTVRKLVLGVSGQLTGKGILGRVCCHPCRGTECENCVPWQGKRRRDTTDEGPFIRPIKRAR